MVGEENVLELPREQIEDTTHRLISSRRVEGTPVYNPEGEKLGTVHSIMLDKRSGRAVYAVMSFGGFLGIDKLVHPLPWDMLDYQEDRQGYIVSVTRAQLERAPVFRLDEADRPREASQDENLRLLRPRIPGVLRLGLINRMQMWTAPRLSGS